MKTPRRQTPKPTRRSLDDHAVCDADAVKVVEVLVQPKGIAELHRLVEFGRAMVEQCAPKPATLLLALQEEASPRFATLHPAYQRAIFAAVAFVCTEPQP